MAQSILGTYEGECADSNITNLNGLDITREVWENVFNSDEYKEAIDHGFYIGFLGHPEDPNCMDFEHACIVMTEGHIDESGKIYGKFNLIDTPVGRIVKAFQDAGVTFGISVRGAGDILDNSVDPDTFVFRGFDLVTFPAYPNSIPKFTAVAASTDADTRAKYQKVCAAVDKNLADVDSIEALDVLQCQFAKQSKQYKDIEARKQQLRNSCEDTCNNTCQDVNDCSDDITLYGAKVRCMTDLYLEAVQRCRSAERNLIEANARIKSEQRRNAKKVNTIDRIMSAQVTALEKENDNLEKQNKAIQSKYSNAVKCANDLKSKISNINRSNLKYKQKVESSTSIISEKDAIISDLRTKLSETVSAASDQKVRSSNLDVSNSKLKAKLEAAEQLISEYQDAYASLYANAIGVSVTDIPVTASTSVSQIQKLISGATNMSNVFVEPDMTDIDDTDMDDDMITM